MITMTHDRLRVLGPLEFQSVTMLSFSVQGNEHGRMEIMGYINSDHGLKQLYKDFKGTPVALYGAEEESDKLLPIFVGKFEQVILHATGGQIIAECVALTYTADLDRQKKSRSFQDVSMTYADVIWSVLGDTPKAGANFTVGEDVSIDRPIIQYEETDWEFIKRLASELKVQLFADCRVPSPQFDLGLPGYQSDYEFSTPNYTCKIDERFYLLGGSQTGQYKPDFLCYIVEDGQSLRVGSSVQWQQTPLFVCGQRAELRKGEFVFTYTLGRRGLVGMRPYRNKKLTGLALGGTVRSTQGEQITLALDIDEGRNVGSFLFPWRPESGNLMYCMPKVGTRAMLYLQDSDAGSAIAINSPRENGQSCGAMADANMRCFATEHDKKLFMFPDSMGIRGGAPDAPVQIVLDGKSGLLMESAHAVQMIARQGIAISAPTIGASTPQQILLLQSSAATENESLIAPKGTADAAQAAQIIANISETIVPLAAAPKGNTKKPVYAFSYDYNYSYNLTRGTFVNINDLKNSYGGKITYSKNGNVVTLKIDDRTTIDLTAYGNSQRLSPFTYTAYPVYDASGLGSSSMIGQGKAQIEKVPIKYYFDNEGNAYVDVSDDGLNKLLGNSRIHFEEPIIKYEQLNGLTWLDKDNQANTWSISRDSLTDLHRVLYKYGITDKNEVAHFLAQASIESSSGKALREWYNGDDPAIFFQGRDNKKTVYKDGSVVYWNDAPGNPHKPGDGAKYRGAGYLHLTWKMTYYEFSQYVENDKVMDGIDYVADNYAWESAGWFWRIYKDIKVDDKTTVTEVTERVNGGHQGLENRERAYEVFKNLLVD